MRADVSKSALKIIFPILMRNARSVTSSVTTDAPNQGMHPNVKLKRTLKMVGLIFGDVKAVLKWFQAAQRSLA
jgi:hypothetical protein